MKGQRRFITVTRLNNYLGAAGDFERASIPVASIKEIVDPEQNNGLEPWVHVRGKIVLIGKDRERLYVKETQDELVQQIERPVE